MRMSDWIRIGTQHLARKCVPARHVTIAIVYYLAAALAIGAAAAQPQEPKREVFLPAKEKGAIVVVLSGFSGPDWYRDFSSKLAELGYYVVLIDGKVVPIRPTDTRGQDGATNLRKVISEAQSADRAVAGKVALVGLSFGGGGSVASRRSANGPSLGRGRLLSNDHAHGA